MCALTTYVCILQTYLFEVELMWVRAQVCEFKMSCLSLYVPVLCVCVCARVHVRTRVRGPFVVPTAPRWESLHCPSATSRAAHLAGGSWRDCS